MKRPLSFILALIIGWGSVTQPARAFAPPFIYAAYMTASVGGDVYGLAALAGAIGLGAAYLTIEDATHNQVRIPLGENPQNQIPAPSAPATAQQSTSSVTSCSAYRMPFGSGAVSATFAGASPIEACSAACASLGVGSANMDAGRCSDWSYSFSASTSQVLTCPAGYQSSGGACNLVNARQVSDDKACDLLIAQGAFATASDMNCPSSVDGTKIAPMIRDGKVIAYGKNSSGQPLMWEVTPGAQSYTVKEYEQIQTATQTQIKTTTATIDSATSLVTSVQTQTSPGSMSAPSATAAPSVTTTADPTTATNTPTVTQDATKPADVQTCGLPGQPACNINDDSFEGKDNFSNPRKNEIDDKLDQNKSQLENSKDSIPDISASWLPSLMPGNATACSPLVFDFTLHNKTAGTLSAPNVQLDICDKLDLVRAILGYMLGMWTVWYVWRRFTSSNVGA